MKKNRNILYLILTFTLCNSSDTEKKWMKPSSRRLEYYPMALEEYRKISSISPRHRSSLEAIEEEGLLIQPPPLESPISPLPSPTSSQGSDIDN